MRDADTVTEETVDRRLPTRPSEEIARMSKEIYERDIRSEVEAAHVGEVVAIDVESGSYALGKNAIVASKSLRDQHPDAHVWLMRGWSSGVVSLRRQLPSESRLIEGTVNAHLEAIVALPLLGPTGQAREIDAVVDTGFNGYLTVQTVSVHGHLPKRKEKQTCAF